MRMLVMCVANSARSQMAEGWVRALATDAVEVHSAGSHPTKPRPEAIAVMAEVGIDLSGHRSKRAADLPRPHLVATLCAEEVCPVYPGGVEHISWATEDPASDTGTMAERLARFRIARDHIGDVVADFLRQRGLARRFGAAVRDQFALDPDIAFLNHGSFGATPRSVLAAQAEWIAQLEAAPVRFMLRQPERVQAVTARLAALLGCAAPHLTMVANASTAVAAVLRSQDLGPGDTIVTTTHAYEAVNRLLAFVAARSGARVVAIPIPFPLADPDEVVAAVAAGWPDGAKLAVFDHITSGTGLHLPIAQLVALSRARGVPVFVDAAHAPGHTPVNLRALGADYWTGNIHKWLFAPKGCAVLYARPEHHDTLHPLVISLGHGQGLQSAFGWQGTRDPSPWLAAGAALDFAEAHGLDAIRAHNALLRQSAGERVAAALGADPMAPSSMLRALQTIPLPATLPGTRAAADDISRRLHDEHRVEAMVLPFDDRLWLRISAQIYNTLGDYDRLIAGLSAVL